MRLTVTVPDDVADQAKQLAADTDRSVSAVVADALAGHVAGERRRRAFEAIDALVGAADVSATADDDLRAARAASDRAGAALGL